MRVTTLIENTALQEGLRFEHGLSLYLELDGKRYLIDTGASGGFIENARTLGLPLDTLEAVIISHNHSDHIGGLAHLFALNPDVKVYIKREAQGDFFLGRGLFKLRVSATRQFFQTYADRFVWVDGHLALSDKISLWAVSDRDEAFVCKDDRLTMKQGWRTVPDSYAHELFVTVQGEGGIAILSSCSHNGIVNIVAEAARQFPGQSVTHVIGGFHMKGAGGLDTINCTPEDVAAVAAQLKAYDVGQVYTGHCTGQKAFELLDSHLGSRVEYLSTGTVVEI